MKITMHDQMVEMAKVKAEEIVNHFLSINEKTDSCFGICDSVDATICDHTGHGCGLWKTHAVKSAHVLVGYMIEEQEMWQNGQADPVPFWQEVKKYL